MIIRPLATPAALSALLTAMPAGTQTQAVPDSDKPYIRLSYPRDKERPLARVDGREISLEDLARYIEERHRPGFREFLATPAGNLYFDSPWIATWLRQYADIAALRSEARYREQDLEAAEPFLSDALKEGFESWLESYREQREREGRPLPLDQERINRLLTDYQNDYGLEAEVLGWLDFMVPDNVTDEDVREYYNAHARIFGGRINLSHILIHTRDPYTGILLDGEAAARARARLADAQVRIRPDGSNFEEVARLVSDDRRTADRGGLFPNVMRFDPRLPAALCRTAWYLSDGEVSEPFETPYGTHIVKKISFQVNTFVLFTEEIIPQVRTTLRQHRQEDLLFELRRRRRVELLY